MPFFGFLSHTDWLSTSIARQLSSEYTYSRARASATAKKKNPQPSYSAVRPIHQLLAMQAARTHHEQTIPHPPHGVLTPLLAESHVDQVGILFVIFPLEFQLVRVQGGEVLFRFLSGRGSQTLSTPITKKKIRKFPRLTENTNNNIRVPTRASSE